MLQTPFKGELAKLLRAVDLDPRCAALFVAQPPAQSTTVAAHCIDALRDLFARLPLKALDSQAAARRAQAVADTALRLCDFPIEINAQHVVAACAWLDAGKALLDAVSPAPTPPLVDAPGPAAASTLEAEAEAFGADHALAGKWLAERWGLPTPVAEAIWLHHHSLTTIEVAADQPRTCYFVALADALAEFRLSGSAPQATPWIEELCKRLGLRVKEALAAARPSERPKAAKPQPEVAAPTPSAVEARYRALCAMHEQLHVAETADDILIALANALREALGCPGGHIAAAGVFVAWENGPASRIDAASTPDLAHGTTLPLQCRDARLGEVTLKLPAAPGTPVSAVLTEIARALEAAAAVLVRMEVVHRATERTEAFASALHRAEAHRQRGLQSERLAGLAKFAAGAAHEINNPLAVISGRAQLLLSQATAPEQQRSLDTIVQQSRRISKIVSDLMQFARPPEPKWALTGVQHLLHQLAASMHERLRAKHIVLEENYAPAMPRVRMDRHQVEQALMHGLLNAEHAMEAKGGILSINVRPVGDAVEIQIRDTGPGIPIADLSRVFDPFFTTKQFHEGSTGLGLTVCRGIIDAHEGRVAIASRVGEGSVLTITLPAAEAAAESSPVVETLVDDPALDEPGHVFAVDQGHNDVIEAELGITSSPAALPPSVHSIHEASPAPALSATQAEAIIERVFPRTAAPAPRPAANLAVGNTPPGVGRILLIEENEDLREVLRAALASHGLSIDTAPDGLEGLASALAHPPALILASTQLSGVDIVTLIRQVRQRFANLPIIALGGPGADDLAPEALRAGARALLHKPFDFDRLLHEIAPHLVARSVA